MPETPPSRLESLLSRIPWWVRCEPLVSHVPMWAFTGAILVMTGLVIGTVNAWEVTFAERAANDAIEPQEIRDLAGFVRLAWVGSLLGFGAVIGASALLGLAVRRQIHARVRRAADFATSCSIQGRVGVLERLGNDAIGDLEEALLVTSSTVGDQRGALERELARQRFAAEVQNALELTDCEKDAFEVLDRALVQELPRARVQVLLADNSHAHLRTALRRSAGESECPVQSPQKCAAVRRGQTLRFPDSEALDACPRLRQKIAGRCSAVCTPVSIMGRAVGVIHSVGEPLSLPDPVAVAKLETLATVIGARVGMLRSLDRSRLQAETDPLTGLLNRRAFEERAATSLSQGGPHAVVMLDLDHFKLLNDRAGHAAGDRALQLFARTLDETMRGSDIVARYGGEEFIVCLPDCRQGSVEKLLKRLRDNLSRAIERSGGPTFTVSSGVALAPIDGSDLESLQKRADQALYGAKGQGRNCTVLYSALPEQGPVEVQAS